MKSDLDVRRMVLDRATVSWDAYNDQVEIRWMTDPYDKVIAERRLRVEAKAWVARVKEIEDAWRVTSFGSVMR